MPAVESDHLEGHVVEPGNVFSDLFRGLHVIKMDITVVRERVLSTPNTLVTRMF